MCKWRRCKNSVVDNRHGQLTACPSKRTSCGEGWWLLHTEATLEQRHLLRSYRGHEILFSGRSWPGELSCKRRIPRGNYVDAWHLLYQRRHWHDSRLENRCTVGIKPMEHENLRADRTLCTIIPYNKILHAKRIQFLSDAPVHDASMKQYLATAWNNVPWWRFYRSRNAAVNVVSAPGNNK